MSKQSTETKKSPALRTKEGAGVQDAVLPKTNPIEAASSAAPLANPSGKFGGHALEGTLNMPPVGKIPYSEIEAVNIYGGRAGAAKFKDYIEIGYGDKNRTATEKQTQLSNVDKLFAAIPNGKLGTPQEAALVQKALGDGNLSEAELKKLPEKVFVMQLIGKDGKHSIPGLVSITHPVDPTIQEKDPVPPIVKVTPPVTTGYIDPGELKIKTEKVKIPEPNSSTPVGPEKGLALEMRGMTVMGADGKVAPGIKAVYLTGGAADLTLAINQYAQPYDLQTYNRGGGQGSVEHINGRGASVRAGVEKMFTENLGLGVDAGANVYERNRLKFPNANTVSVTTNQIAVEPTVGATAILKSKGVSFGLGGQLAKSGNTAHFEIGTSVDNALKLLGLK